MGVVSITGMRLLSVIYQYSYVLNINIYIYIHIYIYLDHY